jgi:hypothetical protein
MSEALSYYEALSGACHLVASLPRMPYLHPPPILVGDLYEALSY